MESESRNPLAVSLMRTMTRMRWLERLVLAAIRRWPGAPVLWSVRQRYGEALAATEKRDRWVSVASGTFLLMDASNLYSQVYVSGATYEPATTEFVLEHLPSVSHRHTCAVGPDRVRPTVSLTPLSVAAEQP